LAEEEKATDTDNKNKPDWEDNITNRMLHWSYTDEQKAEVKKAIAEKIPKSVILSFFYPKTSPQEMAEICSRYLAGR
jgi:type IV secretion system protein VirD4